MSAVPIQLRSASANAQPTIRLIRLPIGRRSAAGSPLRPLSSNGFKAVPLLERDPTIELVMSDIVMPGGMGGFELARTLRESRPELPVLLATGYSQYAQQAVTDGFIIIEKPYHREALATSIRRAIERGYSGPCVGDPDMPRSRSDTS
jgi:CheY-like chemotaxis protein